jgi:HD-GYP domain-containing protein (c-di-GMP phosphodiesterase class II)
MALVKFNMPRSVKGDILYPFATLSLIAVVLVGVALAYLIGHEVDSRMRSNAAGFTADSVLAVVQPQLEGVDLQAPLTGPAYDALQQAVNRYVLSDDIRRIRLVNRAGVVVYSSNPSEIGSSLPGTKGVQSALSGKTVGAEESGSTGDGGVSPLLDVYAPFYSSISHDLAGTIEVDRDYLATASSIASTQRFLYLSLGLGLLGLYAVLQAGAWGVTRALAQDHARLTDLYKTGEHVRSSLDLHEVLNLVVRDSALVVHGQYSVVCLAEKESGGLVARATYDHEKKSVALHEREVTDWLLHRVLATGETNAVADWRIDYARVFSLDISEPMSVVCVPMSLRNKVTGVIVVLRRAAAEGFSREESKMLEELAAQSAMAIEQANLFARVRAYASELELSYDTTLKALTAALDAKDAATEGHSERVAELTVAIAREMKLPEEKLIDIERGALLHDVGKIGVPDEILRKPSTLTRREWQAMQQHPLLAGILVSKVGFLEGALPILLYHHERYDGKGYPFGLSRDRIPLEARIFAVVDAYDAITSERPYRKAGSREDALNEITRHSGSQFDPAVVDVFMRVIERFPLETEEEALASKEDAA